MIIYMTGLRSHSFIIFNLVSRLPHSTLEMFLCLLTPCEVAGGRDTGYREAEIEQILAVKEEILCF